MLIEQIIEFELRRPGPPRRTCTPIPGYFYDKTKISQEDLQGNYFIIYWKILQEVMQITSPNWAKAITKFNPKM